MFVLFLVPAFPSQPSCLWVMRVDAHSAKMLITAVEAFIESSAGGRFEPEPIGKCSLEDPFLMTCPKKMQVCARVGKFSDS